MKNFVYYFKQYAYLIYLAVIIGGMFDARIALVAIVCMIGPIVTAFAGKGRFWCGNICPRGIFFDKVVKKFSGKKPIPKFMKSLWFKVGAVVVLFGLFGMNVYNNWDNATAFALGFYRMILATSILGIVLGSYYNHRAWCSFCPVGTIASSIASNKNKTASCTSCFRCAKGKSCSVN